MAKLQSLSFWVWQQGVELVEMFYKMTQEFPRHEQFGLWGQMQPDMVSIASNIAQGHSRLHHGEHLQFLSVARGLLSELETQQERAFRSGYISEDNHTKALSFVSFLGKQITSLRHSLSK